MTFNLTISFTLAWWMLVPVLWTAFLGSFLIPTVRNWVLVPILCVAGDELFPLFVWLVPIFFGLLMRFLP